MNGAGRQAAPPGKVPWHSSRVVVGKTEVHSREWNFNLELSVEVAKKTSGPDDALNKQGRRLARCSPGCSLAQVSLMCG